MLHEIMDAVEKCFHNPVGINGLLFVSVENYNELVDILNGYLEQENGTD
jgi:hypothetical protein